MKKDAPLPLKNEKEIRRVTYDDIAKTLGISTATVSLALSNHLRIPIATRTRVQQKAIEMNYYPDPMLATLSNHR